MAKYHKYVFDVDKREFVGKFEEMYRAENTDVFDSWHQEDSRQLQRKIDLAIIDEYCFKKILDIGCGKGTLTHVLKKNNNQVLAVDVSETAVKFAQERYPDILFKTANVSNIEQLNKIFKDFGRADLVFSSEVFSYIQNWREVIAELSKNTDYFLISLYIPENPIGFIKSEEELYDEISENFGIVEHITLRNRFMTVILAKSKR